MARPDVLGTFCSRSCSASFHTRGTKRHLGFKHSSDVIAVIKEKRALQVISEDTRLKMHNSHIGKKKSKEHAINIRLSKIGPNNPNWKGGITDLRKAVRKLPNYHRWRTEVFIRDGFKCVLCGDGGKLQVDHYPITYADLLCRITSTEDALKCETLWNVGNGRTLCIKCHRQSDTYGFKNRMANKFVKKIGD